MKPLFLEVAPKTTDQIIGRSEQVAQIKKFLADFPKSKSLLLYGPCGSGKTSAVVALAQEMNHELFEVNASDVRNKSQIEEKLGPAVKQKSFFHAGKIILMDEVDGLSGMKDRGGVSALVKIIDESSVPIICTANDLSKDGLKPLIKKSQTIAFDKLDNTTVFSVLKRAAESRNIKIEDTILHKLVRGSDGDVRAALNDLEILSINPDYEILGSRKRTQAIEDAITTVFKTTDAVVARDAFLEVAEDMNKHLLWIDYNIAFEYTKPKDLARAYGAISKAEVYLSRIRRKQEWRFLIYAGALLTSGVAVAKDAPYAKKVPYKQSSRLLKIWQVNMSNAKRKIIAEKIGEATHCSQKVAFKQMDYIRVLFRHNAPACPQIISELDLQDDEVAWLKK